MPLTITRAQRDAIYAQIIWELSSIDDIAVAINRGDYAHAQRLRCSFATEMRLLDDIGWAPDDPGEHFELTLPDQQLTAILDHLTHQRRLRLRASVLARVHQADHTEAHPAAPPDR